jgi:putative hemolysin
MLFIELSFIFFLILVNGFFAASEIALISLRKSRVRHLVKSGSQSAKRVQKLQEEPERFLGTVQIGVTLIGTLASALGGVIAIEQIKPILQSAPIEFVSKTAEPIALGVVVTIITYVTLVAGELAPKSLAIRYSEQIAFLTATPIDALSRLFRPILR